MERKKNYTLLIVGAVLLIGGILFSLYTYRTSYAQSVLLKEDISEISEQIEALQNDAQNTDAGDTEGDSDALEEDLSSLEAELQRLEEEKLDLERPYSYGLILLFFAFFLTARGIYNAFIGQTGAQQADIKRLAQAGLLAALCYIGFTFFKIDIPVGTEKTAFHLGNVFCVLAALLLGGYWGGLSGAVGMTIADLTTAYVTSAPKTFLLKLLIGLIVGLVAHRICRLSQNHSVKYVTISTILASAAGMGFNIIADPVVGYFYKTYLLGVPQDLAASLAKLSALTTAVNAVVAVVCSTIFYLALRPALKKSGLFIDEV